MEKAVHGLYTRLTSWLVQVETVFAPLQSPKPSVGLLRERGKLMLEGMLLACQGRNMWQAFVAIHVNTDTAIVKRNIQHLSLVRSVAWHGRWPCPQRPCLASGDHALPKATMLCPQ